MRNRGEYDVVSWLSCLWLLIFHLLFWSPFTHDESPPSAFHFCIHALARGRPLPLYNVQHHPSIVIRIKSPSPHMQSDLFLLPVYSINLARTAFLLSSTFAIILLVTIVIALHIPAPLFFFVHLCHLPIYPTTHSHSSKWTSLSLHITFPPESLVFKLLQYPSIQIH
jgi:hypothetical protein